MKITDFIATPKPTLFTLDQPEVIEAYGEALDGFLMLPVPLDLYVKMQDTSAAMTNIDLVRELLVDENGNKKLTPEQSLHPTLIGLIANKIWNELGKLPGRN